MAAGQPRSPVAAIIGPTASGKSELAIAVAHQFTAHVVSADAYQLYRGLDIGTGKVTRQQREQVPHHLIDIAEPSRDVSVAEFQLWARQSVRECHDNCVTPVLVGGSSLYVRAVVDDFEFPGTDPRIRAKWQAELDRLGSVQLHRRLAQTDPEAAAQILPSNGRRIVRALEVGQLTQKPFPAELPAYASIYDDLRVIGIDIDRNVLDDRIEERVVNMWEAGWADEVHCLLRRGMANWPTASRALGYREVMQYCLGERDREDTISAIIGATRRFARRQQRIFRQDPRIIWLRHDDPQLIDAATRILVSE